MAEGQDDEFEVLPERQDESEAEGVLTRDCPATEVLLMKPHPYSSVFPLMSESEFAGLVSDIKANGLTHPIITYLGMVLDGRNRLVACQQAGVEPRYSEFAGTDADALSFVVSSNLHRRHLTSGQLAASAAKADEILGALREAARERKRKAGEEGGILSGKVRRREETKVEERFPQPSESPREKQSRDTLAAQFGTNPRYVQDAIALKKDAPDLLEAVSVGEMTLPEAKRERDRRKSGDAGRGYGPNLEVLWAKVSDATMRTYRCLGSRKDKRAFVGKLRELLDKLEQES
jgi:hypothetical protein